MLEQSLDPQYMIDGLLKTQDKQTIINFLAALARAPGVADDKLTVHIADIALRNPESDVNKAARKTLERIVDGRLPLAEVAMARVHAVMNERSLSSEVEMVPQTAAMLVGKHPDLATERLMKGLIGKATNYDVSSDRLTRLRIAAREAIEVVVHVQPGLTQIPLDAVKEVTHDHWNEQARRESQSLARAVINARPEATEGILDYLKQGAQDKSVWVRELAYGALQVAVSKRPELADSLVKPVVAALINPKDTEYGSGDRKLLATIIENRPDLARPALAFVQRLVDYPQSEVRVKALDVIDRLIELRPAVANTGLVKKLTGIVNEDSDEAVRSAAYSVLGVSVSKNGRLATADLMRSAVESAVNDPNADIRTTAQHLTGVIARNRKNPEFANIALSALANATDNGDQAVREARQLTLREMFDERPVLANKGLVEGVVKTSTTDVSEAVRMAGQEVLATIIEKRSELIELGMVRQIVGAAIKDPSDGVKQEGRRIIKGLTAKQPEIAGTILDIATETLADADRLFRRGSRLVIRAVAQQLPQMAGRAEELIESSRPPKVPNLARSTKALLALSVDQ